MLILAIFGALGLAACFSSVRTGMLVCVLVGFLADPIRKLVPGEPVVLVAAVVAFAAVTVAGEWKRGMRLRLPRAIARDRRLTRPLKLFGALVLIQTAVGLVATHSAVIAGIGLIAYFAPIPAVLIAARYARTDRDLARFFSLYIILTTVWVSGVYLSLLGSTSVLLNAVGVEQVVYSPTTGEEIRLLCGFFRSSENAAWHAATAACFLILLWTSLKRKTAANWFALSLIPVLVIAIPLTGRRKAFMTLVLFIVLYGALLVYFRRGAKRLVNVVVGVFAVTSIFLALISVSGNAPAQFVPYFERGRAATGSSAIERLKGMTVDSFGWVIKQNGYLGTGAGTGSQGSQHFGGGSDIVGYAAEGGLGKVLAELGVPGLAVLLWIAAAGFGSLKRMLALVNRGDPARARLIFGAVAFLASNSVEFMTAHQIFGDPFVLLILGWVAGFLLTLLDQQLSQIESSPVVRPAAPPPRAARALPPGRPWEGIPGI